MTSHDVVNSHLCPSVQDEEKLRSLGTFFGSSLTWLVLGVREHIKYACKGNETNNKQR